MTNINFDYELPSGTTLNVEAEIVSEGTPPAHYWGAEPGEDPEIEIVECVVLRNDGNSTIDVDVTGLWFRKFASTNMTSVIDDMKDLAWDKYESGK